MVLIESFPAALLALLETVPVQLAVHQPEGEDHAQAEHDEIHKLENEQGTHPLDQEVGNLQEVGQAEDGGQNEHYHQGIAEDGETYVSLQDLHNGKMILYPPCREKQRNRPGRPEPGNKAG